LIVDFRLKGRDSTQRARRTLRGTICFEGCANKTKEERGKGEVRSGDEQREEIWKGRREDILAIYTK
jgi:hypothetical protein